MAAPRDKCDDQLCDYAKSKSVSCFSCHKLVTKQTVTLSDLPVTVRGISLHLLTARVKLIALFYDIVVLPIKHDYARLHLAPNLMNLTRL